MTSYPRAGFRYAFWSGLALVHFALLLHPMDPLDFLALAYSDPFAGISEPNGFGPALLFWSAAVMLAAGAVGMAAKAWSALAAMPRRAPKTSFPLDA